VRHLCSRTRHAPPKLRQERHRRAGTGGTAVAQVSKPAVPPISNRQGVESIERPAGWKPAIQQTRRSALRSGHEIASAECGGRKAEDGKMGIQRDAAPNGARGVFGGAGSTEISPLRGLICYWRDGFYRDGAPTALGLWGKRVTDDRDAARIAQIEHRRCDIFVAARAHAPQSSVRSGIAAHVRIAQIEHRRCDISVAARADQHPQSSVRSGIAKHARGRRR
jgi:hypothetical protein